MKALFTAIFLSVSSSIVAQDTLVHQVYFNRDIDEPNTKEEEKLLSWLKSLPDSVVKIEVIGYADFLGGDDYNLKLSERRANHVLELIEASKSIRYKMSLTSAFGEEHSTETSDPDGIPQDRKVEVKVVKYPLLKMVETKPVPKKSETELISGAIDLLPKMKVGETVVLNNLNFYPGRHYLVPAALPELERLIQILQENPNMEIEIQGHICCKLDSIDGLDVNTQTYSLSANRAEYIFDQLVLAGISAERMKHRGFAGSRPLIVPEITETDRARNRRVEIMILKN